MKKKYKAFMMMKAKTKNQAHAEVGLDTYQAENMEINHTEGLNLRQGGGEGGSICQVPGSKAESHMLVQSKDFNSNNKL